MRVAPIGLFFTEQADLTLVAELGAEAAALTHGHELGYLPAAVLACLIHEIVYHPRITLTEAITTSLHACKKHYPLAKHWEEMEQIITKAMALAQEDRDDLESIRALGEGWVAEETLAIAVYCAVKYEKDFESAIIAAVNHSGDSDSTGAVTGNILGAYLGYAAIPPKYTEALELKTLILEIAEDLGENG